VCLSLGILFNLIALVLAVFSLIGSISNTNFVKDIYFERLDLNVYGDFVNFGLWSWCYGKNVTIYSCSAPTVGYTFLPENGTAPANLTGIPTGFTIDSYGPDHFYTGDLYTAGVCYLVGAILLVIAILFFGIKFGKSTGFVAGLLSFLASLFSFGAFILIGIAFILILLIFVSQEYHANTNGLTGLYGNAIWMTLGAFLASGIASSSYLCSICTCCGRKAKHRTDNEEAKVEETADKPKGGFFNFRKSKVDAA